MVDIDAFEAGTTIEALEASGVPGYARRWLKDALSTWFDDLTVMVHVDESLEHFDGGEVDRLVLRCWLDCEVAAATGGLSVIRDQGPDRVRDAVLMLLGGMTAQYRLGAAHPRDSVVDMLRDLRDLHPSTLTAYEA